MRILVTGKTGQVGWELTRALLPLGEVVAPARAELDLARPESIRDAMSFIRPEIVVNAGAYTAVDKAESEPELAMAVNARAPGVLAEEARRIGAFMVHYSTDYVFDGAKASAYDEDDEPNPLNVYGASKLAGERAVQDAGEWHLILRTSWVYGTRGKNFLLKILELAVERGELRVVDDQIGAPTWSRSIAEATARVLKMWIDGDHTEGLFHLTAGGATSWCRFAEAILRQGAIARAPRVVPIPSSEYPTTAKRPKNSVLSNKRFVDAFGFALEPWEEELDRALAAREGCGR